MNTSISVYRVVRARRESSVSGLSLIHICGIAGVSRADRPYAGDGAYDWARKFFDLNADIEFVKDEIEKINKCKRTAAVGVRTAVLLLDVYKRQLQDMLHNMDKFFARLLDQKSYGDLLREHLDGYVEEIVRKKYHILKTSDNFYIYKMDIKKCLRDMREDEAWIEPVSYTHLDVYKRQG